jgi:hypothetical protein
MPSLRLRHGAFGLIAIELGFGLVMALFVASQALALPTRRTMDELYRDKADAEREAQWILGLDREPAPKARIVLEHNGLATRPRRASRPPLW